MTIPLTQLPRAARRAAKARLVAGMNAGLSWHEAAARAEVTTSEATAYRLCRRVRYEGDTARDDHRQGVAYKLSLVVRQWIITYCHDHPYTTRRDLQTVLITQHDVLISVGYLNHVRAALGIRLQHPFHEKKR